MDVVTKLFKKRELKKLVRWIIARKNTILVLTQKSTFFYHFHTFLTFLHDIPRRCNFQALLASPLTRTPRTNRRKTIGESLRNASLLARGSEPIMKQHLEMLHKQESKDNKSSDKLEKLRGEKNSLKRRSLALGKNFSSSRLENAMAVYCSSPSTRKMAIV